MARSLYSALYVLFFIFFFSVAFFTPMHSDDYTYYTFGFNPDTHLAHYIRWSGRVISDYISPFILSFSNNIIISLFTSTAATLLIFTISLIARDSNKITYNDCLISLYAFLLYWLSNTNLGQTTFWVVGTANYLWTSLFILLFIYRILNNKKISILTLILAFISSCSNENSGYIPFLLCLYLLLVEFYKYKKINKIILIYSVVSLTGFLILILAPGNYFRASLYPDWYSKPIYEKLFIHFIDRVPMILSSLWLVFCSFSIISIFSDCNKNKNKNTRIIIFLLFSALSLTALFAAPSYQSRSANIVLIFLLCAISIFIRQLSFKKTNQKIALFIVFVYILFTFITSYTLILKNYINLYNQNKFRIALIEKEKDKGNKDITIPDFFHLKLLKDTDGLDRYHDPIAYGRYFGVEKINIANLGFNYSSLYKAKTIIINKSIEDNFIIDKIILSENSIVFITNKDVNNNFKFFIHAYEKNKNYFINYDFKPKNINMNNVIYNGTNIDFKNIEKLIIGLFNGDNRYFEYEILL